jgi:quinol monooxygenase YgiN
MSEHDGHDGHDGPGVHEGDEGRNGHEPHEPHGGEVELCMVSMRFRAADVAALAAILSQYVVLTRREPGSRNVDFCVSASDPATFVIVEKWESPQHQQAHFDGATMVSMAKSCQGLLQCAPDIELLDPISAHDLH